MGGILDQYGEQIAAISGSSNSQGFKRGLLEKGMTDGLNAPNQLSSEQERLHQIMQGMTLPQLMNMIAPRLDAMNAIRQDTGMSNPFVQFMMRGQGGG